MKTVRTDSEISRVENWALAPGENSQDAEFREGGLALLYWLIGESRVAPDEGSSEEFRAGRYYQKPTHI